MARPALTVLLLLAACSVETAPRLADQTHPIQPNIPAPPAAPMLPAAPVLTPCPDGWREVAAANPGDAVTCDPWPVGGAQDCGADLAHFPGTPGCSVIGSACPTGEWPEGLPAGVPVLYVRAATTASGSGTQAAPFASIKAAVAGASAGTIVALGKGTFNETVLIPKGVTLWGACVAQTHVISVPANVGNATLRAMGEGVVIRNLQVGGVVPGIAISQPGATLDVRDVVISNAHDLGLFAAGAVKLTGSRLVVRATQPRAGINDLGDGVWVSSGAQVELRWLSVEASRTTGVQVYGQGTQVKLFDAAVRGTLPALSSGFYGQGLFVHDQARLEGARLAIEHNSECGLSAETGGQLSLSDAVISDIAVSDPKIDSGFGGKFLTGATVDLHRVLLRRALAAALVVEDPGTTTDLTDVVIRDTLGQAGRPGSFGIHVSAAALKSLRLAIERTVGLGLAGGKGSVVDVEDITARNSGAAANDAGFGGGFSADVMAKWTVARALVEDTTCIAIQVQASGTSVDAVDVTVRGTRACPNDGIGGQGLAVIKGASVSMGRVLFEKNRATTVVASDVGTLLKLTDAQVIDTLVEQGLPGTGGAHGEGLTAQYGGQIELARARFERNHEAGLVVAFGGKITASDLVVTDTLLTDCPRPQCASQGGLGVMVLEDSRIKFSRFSITRSGQLGVLLARGGVGDLESGEIAENPIGVNVQTAGFDLTRLQHDVIFRANQVTLNADVLPLPDALPAIR